MSRARVPGRCCKRMKETLYGKDRTGLVYDAVIRTAGIRVLDGGSSYLCIRYCPFCGQKFLPSLWRQWYRRLDKSKLDGGESDEELGGLASDRWWKKRLRHTGPKPHKWGHGPYRRLPSRPLDGRTRNFDDAVRAWVAESVVVDADVIDLDTDQVLHQMPAVTTLAELWSIWRSLEDACQDTPLIPLMRANRLEFSTEPVTEAPTADEVEARCAKSQMFPCLYLVNGSEHLSRYFMRPVSDGERARWVVEFTVVGMTHRCVYDISRSAEDVRQNEEYNHDLWLVPGDLIEPMARMP